MTPDVNVLVAASRSDHTHHTVAAAWLDEAIRQCATGGTLRLVPLVVASFLRLVTHPKIFNEPTPIEAAVKYLDALLAIPGVVMPALGAEWPALRQLALGKKLAGNSLPDAWLAAVVTHLGDHLVTFDADFKQLLRHDSMTLLLPPSR